MCLSFQPNLVKSQPKGFTRATIAELDHLFRKSDYSLAVGTANCCSLWSWKLTSFSCVLGLALPGPRRPDADLTVTKGPRYSYQVLFAYLGSGLVASALVPIDSDALHQRIVASMECSHF